MAKSVPCYIIRRVPPPTGFDIITLGVRLPFEYYFLSRIYVFSTAAQQCNIPC